MADPTPLPDTLAEAPEGARMAQPDDLIPIPTRGGGRQFLPVSAVARLGGELYGGREMLTEAAQIRQESARDRAEAEQHRTLMRQLSNPQTATQAFAGLSNIARQQGVDVDTLIASLSATPGGTNPSQQVASTATPQDPHTRDLDARLRRFEDREQQTAFEARIGDVMATYFPGVDVSTEKGKQFAALARQQVMAAQVVQPDKPLEQCAREVHQSYVDAGLVTSLQRTQVRDALRANGANPAVNPNAGAPPTATAVSDEVGAKALSSGGFRNGLANALRAAQNALGPNPSAP